MPRREWGLPPIKGIRVHDPSAIVKSGDRYYCFSTGTGIVSSSSADLEMWTAGPPVFPTGFPPEEVRANVPNFRGHIWAPDLIQLGDRYALYYCASAFGKQTSSIGLVTSSTLDPNDPDYAWRHEGVVLRSAPGEPYNAIDPFIYREGGQLWMVFGSYWEGIFLVELDAATGLRLANSAAPVRLADSESIEAAAVLKHGEYYYLFVNFGQCCQGVKSTYRIAVGRSKSLAGPYVDRAGVDLRDGGGDVVLDTRGKRIGPGHVAPVVGRETELFGYHYYDATDFGRPKLGIARWRWSADGWPKAVTEKVLAPRP